MERYRVDVEALIIQYPRLFHMAAAGAWPSIAAHGLLTTRDLVAGSELEAAERAAILDERRLRSVQVDHPTVGVVTVRDQSPLRQDILQAVLADMSPGEWLDLLNGQVFFWLHPRRLASLLRSRPNRNLEHDVLTVDTASLVAAHHDRIRLSPINSGATQWPSAPRRGRDTFLTIEDYPYAERRRGRGVADAVAELTVVGGVADIADHVVDVQRRRGSDVVADLALSSHESRT
jgi:hypothetical protein